MIILRYPSLCRWFGCDFKYSLHQFRSIHYVRWIPAVVIIIQRERVVKGWDSDDEDNYVWISWSWSAGAGCIHSFGKTREGEPGIKGWKWYHVLMSDYLHWIPIEMLADLQIMLMFSRLTDVTAFHLHFHFLHKIWHERMCFWNQDSGIRMMALFESVVVFSKKFSCTICPEGNSDPAWDPQLMTIIPESSSPSVAQCVFLVVCFCLN